MNPENPRDTQGSARPEAIPRDEWASQRCAHASECHKTGNFDDALKAYEEAVATDDFRLKKPVEWALAQGARSTLLGAVKNDPQKALKAATAAVEVPEFQESRPADWGMMEGSRAHLLREIGENDKAAEAEARQLVAYNRVVEDTTFRKEDLDRWAAVQGMRVTLLREAGKPEEARQARTQQIEAYTELAKDEAFQKAKPEAWAVGQERLGEIFAEIGKDAEALEAAQRAHEVRELHHLPTVDTGKTLLDRYRKALQPDLTARNNAIGMVPIEFTLRECIKGYSPEGPHEPPRMLEQDASELRFLNTLHRMESASRKDFLKRLGRLTTAKVKAVFQHLSDEDAPYRLRAAELIAKDPGKPSSPEPMGNLAEMPTSAVRNAFRSPLLEEQQLVRHFAEIPVEEMKSLFQENKDKDVNSTIDVIAAHHRDRQSRGKQKRKHASEPSSPRSSSHTDQKKPRLR